MNVFGQRQAGTCFLAKQKIERTQLLEIYPEQSDDLRRFSTFQPVGTEINVSFA